MGLSPADGAFSRMGLSRLPRNGEFRFLFSPTHHLRKPHPLRKPHAEKAPSLRSQRWGCQCVSLCTSNVAIATMGLSRHGSFSNDGAFSKWKFRKKNSAVKLRPRKNKFKNVFFRKTDAAPSSRKPHARNDATTRAPSPARPRLAERRGANKEPTSRFQLLPISSCVRVLTLPAENLTKSTQAGGGGTITI